MNPMPFLIGLARTLSVRAWCLIAVAILSLILILAVYARGRHDAGADRDRRDEKAAAHAQAVNADAIDRAGVETVNDLSGVAAREKERHDATLGLPDRPPSAVRIARACVQLRQQGTAPDRLPAVCRPEG